MCSKLLGSAEDGIQEVICSITWSYYYQWPLAKLWALLGRLVICMVSFIFTQTVPTSNVLSTGPLGAKLPLLRVLPGLSDAVQTCLMEFTSIRLLKIVPSDTIFGENCRLIWVDFRLSSLMSVLLPHKKDARRSKPSGLKGLQACGEAHPAKADTDSIH
jgi:hypothetical protein